MRTARIARSALRAFARHYPLTGLGSLALLTSAGALRSFGYGQMDLVIFALCLCVLIVLVATLFATVIGGLYVQKRLVPRAFSSQAAGQLELEAGYANASGVLAPSLGWLPLIRLEWQLRRPQGINTELTNHPDGTQRETLTPQQRAMGQGLIRHFRVSDALGLSRYEWSLEDDRCYRILPSLGACRALTLQRALANDDGMPEPSGATDGDRMEIRAYAPGDSFRDILWKHFANNRQLNVRLPERSAALDDKTSAYLVSGEGDETAAALARLALESRLLGEFWQFAADGPSPGAASELERALDSIAASKAQDGHRHDYGLDEFIEEKQLQHCVVFAGLDDADTFTRLIETASSRRCRLSLVIGVDQEGMTAPIRGWRRLLTTQRYAVADSSARVKRLTALSQHVESVVVLDRHSGAQLSAAQLGKHSAETAS